MTDHLFLLWAEEEEEEEAEEEESSGGIFQILS